MLENSHPLIKEIVKRMDKLPTAYTLGSARGKTKTMRIDYQAHVLRVLHWLIAHADFSKNNMILVPAAGDRWQSVAVQYIANALGMGRKNVARCLEELEILGAISTREARKESTSFGWIQHTKLYFLTDDLFKKFSLSMLYKTLKEKAKPIKGIVTITFKRFFRAIYNPQNTERKRTGLSSTAPPEKAMLGLLNSCIKSV